MRRELAYRNAEDDVLDLAGNDYLGLSRDPRVVEAACRAARRFGLGATGSRLVRGSTAVHCELEAAAADLLGQPAALVFSSGYLANLAAVAGVWSPGAVILRDAHAHASLVDACRLTGACVEVIPHNDLAALRERLAAHRGRPLMVVTESVFSVDGDLAPLADLHPICRAAGAILVVDDAHAFGVLGPDGGGAVRAAGLADRPDVVVTATLSKALGAAGGIVAGPAEFIDHLTQTARTFVYDTALPPAVAQGALAALEVARNSRDLRDSVTRRARAAAGFFTREGFVVPHPPGGGIVALCAPSAESAVRWARECRMRGVTVGCFRPPSTPDEISRLRVTVSMALSDDEFTRAVEVIASCGRLVAANSLRYDGRFADADPIGTANGVFAGNGSVR